MTKTLVKIGRFFYDPKRWKYDPENPIRIVPINQIENKKELSDVMVSIDHNNSELTRGLMSSWLDSHIVEIIGNNEYKETREDVEIPSSRGGYDIRRNVLKQKYKIGCGKMTINYSETFSPDFGDPSYLNSVSEESLDLGKLSDVCKAEGPITI